MANRTDPRALSVHGGNPQFLVEKILRNRIFDSVYWKETCFGLTAVTVIDKALRLDAVGGIYSANVKPTHFLCLLLKLLQLAPEKEIILEYIHNEEHKYLRALGALYWRLTAKPAEIYMTLEPLYTDYRRLARRSTSGWSIQHMDEFIDELLTSEVCCDVTLPTIPKRAALEAAGTLPRRTIVLDDEIEADAAREEASSLRQSTDSSAAQPAADIADSSTRAAARDLLSSVMSGGRSDQANDGGRDRDTDRDDVRRDGVAVHRDARRYSRSRSRSPRRSRGRRDEEEREDGRRYGRDRERGYDRERDDDRHSRRYEDRDERDARTQRRYDDDDDRDAHRRRRRDSPDADQERGPAKSAGALVEGSTEWWNAERAKLGLKPLK